MTLNGGYVNEYACRTYYNCSLSSGTTTTPTTSKSLSSSSSSQSASPSASPTPKASSSFSFVNKCYKALSSHQAMSINEPGVGASWTQYWKECPCCPTSSVNLTDDLCPIFHVDDEEVRGPWTGREPEHNRNITITQGDTVCYRFSLEEHGNPVNLMGHDIKAYMKLNFSDTEFVDEFATKVINTNVIELSLTAKQTTCLPVTELVYSCEIIPNTSALAANNGTEKVLQGYLRVLPEVTRDDSFCTVFGFGPQPTKTSGSSSSSSASAKPYCCTEYYLNKIRVGTEYVFNLEVSTEQAVLNNISYWEAKLIVNGLHNSTHGMSEVELIQNEADPTKVMSGYDMVYPIGGGRYRFIDKLNFLSTGNLSTIFSVPIATNLFTLAKIQVRYITTNGCTTKWCHASLTYENEVFGDCCPSSSSPMPSPSASYNPNQP